MNGVKDLEARLAEFSSQELDDYKTDLQRRLAGLDPSTRDKVYTRMSTLPQLRDMVPFYEPTELDLWEQKPIEQEKQWWQEPLHYLGGAMEKAFLPFTLYGMKMKEATETPLGPFGALTSEHPAISPIAPVNIMAKIGELGAEMGTAWRDPERSMWEPFREFEEEEVMTYGPGGERYEEYEELPWYQQLLYEAPAWAIASGVGAGQIRAALAPAAKGGAILPKISRAALAPVAGLEALPGKAIGLAGRGISKLAGRKVPQVARLLPDLQPIDEAIAIATQPTKIRNLVNVNIGGRQPLKGIAEVIGGRAATADNPATLALVGRDVLRFEGANKATAAISTLNRLGVSKKIFNLTDEGLIKSGALKGVHLNTIRTYPSRYAGKLTTVQKEWVEQASVLQKEITNLLERNGIVIRKLTFEEGGEYAGRRVVAKFTSNGELIDTAFIGAAHPGRPGAKTAMEKTRVFANIDDAIKEGYRYLPEEEALYYNTIGAYNRVANEKFSQWFLEKVPWRTVAVTGETAEAKQIMLGTQAALKQMRSISMRWKNGESISGQILKGIKAYYPDEYRAIYAAQKAGIKPEQAKLADSLLKFIRQQEVVNKEQWDGIKLAFKQARQEAMRPGFTGTMAPDIPAFAGKVFTGSEAKQWIGIIRKELNPQFYSALNAINQVNAVGRYFALAGDISPATIQLIFLAGAHPRIYGRAMKGFVRAMFDPLYHDNMLAKHITTIQKHPGLILTKGGATEFTEAMGRGGLLRKGPFRIGGKVLEPFQRGFECSLDTAGIYMAEAKNYLCTTAARTAQVDAFVNEFRGLLNTTRIGISSTQRQLERATILAPQYNRAIAALLTDVARGNLRGKLARESLAKGITAIAAMTVAVSYALGESEEEIVEHLNPLSSNFMTWEIGGQRVGPGSKVRSLLYLMGKMIKDPDETAYYAGRFMRGNFSPFLGTSIDLITGKDYIGDPTRDGLPNLTRTVLGENLLPIWVQSVALEGGDLQGRVTRGLAEFGGMRGYPMGAYGEMKALQDKLALQEYRVKWEELNQLQQMQLEREHPDLKELSEKATEESDKWAHGDQVVWNSFNTETAKINEIRDASIEKAAQRFEATGDGGKFREDVNYAFAHAADSRNELLERDEHKIIREYYETPLTEEQISKIAPEDLAYREYNRVLYSDDMYDEFGEYRFDEADIRIKQFIQQYGQETFDYIQDLLGEKRADESDALKLLRRARVLLKPYWEIVDLVWSQYPPELRQLADEIDRFEKLGQTQKAKALLYQYPQILEARKRIAEFKKRMKQQDPRIAGALKLFYSY